LTAAPDVIDGADRVAQFLVGARRKRPGGWWCDDFTVRFATINGLPGVIVDAPEEPVQTAAFEIEGDVIRALYVGRNPDKLRHLAKASAPHDSAPIARDVRLPLSSHSR
jgi:RNA polymerase sigma-70 factor (ECF subfamily)